ncbi:MAG TPA: alpha/beta fold hydrolase [Azospira sp.]|nr:alpha/beta fold hydrolase [Azospira sp.]
MARASVNGVELEYLEQGPAAGPAVLLVMGLGVPLTRWPETLCDALAARGYRVLRFDNRDCGRSTHLDGAPVPDLAAALRGAPLTVPYTLGDMAADGIGLLDHLGIPRAHVVGASMGGAIAQLMAAACPQRLLSLTSLMASSGHPGLPLPTPAASAALFAPLPRQRDEETIVADGMARYRAVASPAYPVQENWLEELLREEYRRGFNPKGVARQLAAIVADGDRRARLASIRVPALVLHGAADPLIPPACGQDVAAHIPGARLHLVDGMGHDLPPQLGPLLAALLADFMDAAGA